ncbi:MAG TPA: LysM peptidoglycan-binding domain-containing protein [Candidatus Binatia bacterium]|nr:LysM peptidoglycan-binding domain-containing protein [Candidatus Binatia bacterium]
MKIEKLTIRVEGGSTITALFNPSKLVLAKSVRWEEQNAKERDVPELQFKNGDPRTLNIDLFFDTYDTPEAAKESVKEKYTDQLLKLMLVDSEKHRPPTCELSWGTLGVFFQGVLEKLDQQFTLFVEDGTPVRATCACTFKEWRTNPDDQRLQQTKSSDVAKTWVVKRGDTLSSIAAKEYLDPHLWRPIAEANAIDDPYGVAPGSVLLIPTLVHRQLAGRY